MSVNVTAKGDEALVLYLKMTKFSGILNLVILVVSFLLLNLVHAKPIKRMVY